MFSEPQKQPRRLPLLVCVLTAGTTGLALAEESPGPPVLNQLVGRVWTQGKREPVPNALVTAIDVVDGFLMYGGPTRVMAHVPEEKFLWFFTKPNEARSGTAHTDAEGRFAIDGMRPGKYHVVIVHPERGMGIWRNVTQPNSGEGLEAVLETPTFVEGTIRGLPGSLEGLHASLDAPMDMQIMESSGDTQPTFMAFNPEFTISPDGSFRAGPLPSGGAWTLGVQRMVPKRNFGVTLVKRSVTMQEGTTTKVDIDLTAGTKLSGQVVGPSGEPLSDVAVQIRPIEQEFGTLTDAEGHFVIGGLPDGGYRIDVQRWLPRTGLG